MATVKNGTGKKVYWFLLILSLVIGFIFYGALKDQFSVQFLIFSSGIPFFLFVTGVFGLLWPVIKPAGDEVYISHALLIGLLFIILFFIHVWILLPHICPNFDGCLGG